MPLNNYLVIGVNPANNETTVALDKDISITFSKHMDTASLTSSTLVLKKVNGEIVPYTMNYVADIMTAKLNPTDNFEPGTQYQIQIVGTESGVKSITGDYMGVSRSYEFTTSFTTALSAPQSLSVSVNDGYPVLTWQRPADYDAGAALSYEIHISTSNDPLTAPLWPSVGDINKTNATVLNVPKKFSEGNYYAYVKAINGTEESDWTSTQFLVEKAATTPTQPPIGGGGGGDIFSFDVADTYPRRDSVDVTPEKVMIVFSGNVDPATVNEDTVYIVKKEDKQNLSLLDFMTEYSPDKKVAATVEPIVTPNMVVLTAVLEDDTEYTVIVRESVANSTGGTLGMAYHWSFMTKFTQLYGDASLIRQDVGSMSSSITDKMLYKFMSDSSKYAYQIASVTAAFDETLYADGAAPYYMHQYVRLRTAYNLLLNMQLRSGGGGSTSRVVLGDLQVEKDSGAGGSITDVLKDLKERMKPFLDMMHGHNNRGYAKPSVVVRGENIEAYPDFMTRSEFRDLGQ